MKEEVWVLEAVVVLSVVWLVLVGLGVAGFGDGFVFMGGREGHEPGVLWVVACLGYKLRMVRFGMGYSGRLGRVV